MTEAVEVAIEQALLDRAQAFATAQGLTIALPNLAFTPPVVGKNAKYLRASFLPADTDTLSVGSGSDRHYGIFQLDVFFGAGGGEPAPARIAAAAISYFKRNTSMTSSGFAVDVFRTPSRGPQLLKDAWAVIPVRIPYQIFSPPA